MNSKFNSKSDSRPSHRTSILQDIEPLGVRILYPEPARSPRRSLPRRIKVYNVFLNHPERGLLLAAVQVRPMPCDRWQVDWNISDWDRDVPLSGRAFTQECYLDEISQLIWNIAKRMRRKVDEIADPEACPRWGYVSGMSERLADEFALCVCLLWKRVVTEWKLTGGAA
jgi:hypothetical protein